MPGIDPRTGNYYTLTREELQMERFQDERIGLELRIRELERDLKRGGTPEELRLTQEAINNLVKDLKILDREISALNQKMLRANNY